MEQIPQSLLNQAEAEIRAFDELKNITSMLIQSRELVRHYEKVRADHFILLKDRYGCTYKQIARVAGIKADRVSEIVLDRREELDQSEHG